jgi:cytochrome c peroxidase
MRQLKSPHASLAGVTLCLLALGAVDASRTRQPTASRDASAQMTALGQAIFHDENLSLNKNQSCASCHDGSSGFAAADEEINANGAVMFGSVRSRFGNRKPPSAAYASESPVFHYDTKDSVWVGGEFWDGRATGQRLGNPVAEQALQPFVNPVEQALPDIACVVYRVMHGAYAPLASPVLGDETARIRFPANTDTLCSREAARVPLPQADRARVLEAYDVIGLSIALFEKSSAMNQFSSKYDAYLAGRATLTAQERRGLELYEKKGKCAACHPNSGERALFTDFTYDNIGVPRNPRNPALRTDSSFRDLGLGGVLGDSTLRGAHKVPTLRNIDRRHAPGVPKAYMHNGVFKTLEEVVHFYNTRDVLPTCESLSHQKTGVNCWPAPEVAENVNTEELGNLELTAEEERALVTYLRTLTDGYAIPRPER